MILAGDKAGHPWHGLWKSSDSTITTPEPVEIDILGDEPSGVVVDSVMELPPGDSIRVYVPDQPAVTTTAEESAEGKTWLNYGILSGLRHRFYGVTLGIFDWLYVAPDKSVWRCTLTYDPPTGGVSVNFLRFGDFTPGVGDDRCVAIANHGSGMGTVSYWVIDDINSDGSKVLVCLFNQPYDYYGMRELKSGVRLCKGGIMLTLSGTPPDVTVSVDVMALPADAAGTLERTASYTGAYYFYRYSGGVVVDRHVEPLEWDYPDEFPANPGPPDELPGWTYGNAVVTSESFTDTWRAIIGLAFASDGSNVIVEATTENIGSWSETITESETEQVYDASGISEVAGTYKISIGTSAATINASAESTWELSRVSFYSGEAEDPGTGSVTKTFADYSETVEKTPTKGIVVSRAYGFGGDSATFEKDDGSSIVSVPVRFGNALYGPASISLNVGGTAVDGVDYRYVVSNNSVDSELVSESALATHFATAHPVTGTISRLATPICYV